MVRWACGQAQWDALHDLLDDLRLNGEYARLVTRARAKLDYDEPPDAPAGIARSEQAAIHWYFAQQRGTAVPDDLAGYAQSCGFPDEQAFRTAVRHEYRYTQAELRSQFTVKG
jgi:AraC-like DNA-binding protein